jgi:hypothetical protein
MTLGVSLAAREGGLLYLFREWLEQITLAKVEKHRDDIAAFKQSYNKFYQDRNQDGMAAMLSCIKAEEKAIFKLTWWQKPILLCHECMPSLWSFVAYLILLLAGYEAFPVVLLLISIPISTLFNHIIYEKYLS